MYAVLLDEFLDVNASDNDREVSVNYDQWNAIKTNTKQDSAKSVNTCTKHSLHLNAWGVTFRGNLTSEIRKHA